MAPYPGLGGAFVLLVAAFAGQVAAGKLLGWLAPGLDGVFAAGLANLAALSAVAVFGFLRSREGPKLRPVQGVGARFWAGLALTVWSGTVVLGELSNVVTWLYPLSPDLVWLFNQLERGDLTISLFTVAVVAPLTEEALFRGLLLRAFARRWGSWPGLVLSSALFALFHLNVWQAPTAFLAGLFLGWLFLRSGSLLYPLVAHAVFNGLPIVLTAVGFSITGYNTPLVPGVVEFQPPLWTACGTLVLALGLTLVAGAFPYSKTPLPFPPLSKVR